MNVDRLVTDTGDMATRRTLQLLLAVLLFLAACGDSDSTADGAATATDDSVAPTTIAIDEEVSDAPEGLAATDGSAAPTTTEADSSGEPDDTVDDVSDEAESPTCEAPEKQLFFVDVDLDDPDGGLNVRAEAGIEHAILTTIPRSGELITTGGCVPFSTVDWWEVTTSDSSLTGWVSSRFLSDLPVFNPGLGAAINDPDNVGLTGETVEEILQQIADSYDFDEDLEITEVDVEGLDAQGFIGTYDLTGLKDDASNGYRVAINIFVERTPDGEEVTGYRTLGVTNFALCTRGVTEDGLCI